MVSPKSLRHRGEVFFGRTGGGRAASYHGGKNKRLGSQPVDWFRRGLFCMIPLAFLYVSGILSFGGRLPSPDNGTGAGGGMRGGLRASERTAVMAGAIKRGAGTASPPAARDFETVQVADPGGRAAPAGRAPGGIADRVATGLSPEDIVPPNDAWVNQRVHDAEARRAEAEAATGRAPRKPEPAVPPALPQELRVPPDPAPRSSCSASCRSES